MAPSACPDAQGDGRDGWNDTQSRTGPSSITVETVRPGQVEAVAALTELVGEYAQSWYEPGEPLRAADMALLASLPGEHAWPDGAAVLGYLSGVPVGCALLGPTGEADTGEVRKVYVRQAARGRGVAAALLEAVEAEAHALLLRRLTLTVHPARFAALPVYRRAGYEIAGRDLDGMVRLGKRVHAPKRP